MLCRDDGDGRDVSPAAFFVFSPRLLALCMRLTVSLVFLACQTAPENASWLTL